MDTSPGGELSLKNDSSGDDKRFQFVPTGADSFFIVNKLPERGALDTRPNGEVRWVSDATPDGEDKRWKVVAEGNGYRLENAEPERGALAAQSGRVVWGQEQGAASVWLPAAQ